MKPNRFRQVVNEGRIPLGTLVWEFGTRGLPKVLEAADIDFVLIDMEHSAFDGEHVADLIAWFKATPIAPFVRVPQRLYHFLARAMDAGALGAMVANVETPEQAREIVNAVKYAPLGKRGVGLGSSHTDFLVPDPAAYFREANENTTVITMIESPLGLANAGAIAATEGVDVLWVGHFDLTQAMGIPAQFHHAQFLEALRGVIAAARSHGKVAAINPSTPEQAEEWISLGFNAISWGNDTTILRNALSVAIRTLRARVAKAAAR
ncbi:MAG: hpch/hpai aldolase [Acidobacteria bacterium]|nr:MAG: hpch/hpai aldolase [Acidobacteriota bacterium]